MSKAITDPSKEYESANGGPEKSFGDTEVKDGVDEGEESDEYGEIEDEVCVQRNHIAKDLGVQSILTGRTSGKTDSRRKRRRRRRRRRGMCLRPANFYVFLDDAHHLQEKQNTLTHLLIGNVSYIYFLAPSLSIDLDKAEWRGQRCSGRRRRLRRRGG